MKRRDFVKMTAAGVSGVVGQGCATMRHAQKPNAGPGFDIHPFVKSNPDAVFINLTDVNSKKDTDGLRSAGYDLAQDLIVKVPNGGYAFDTKVTCKPNWTSAGPKDGKPVYEKLGVNTDPNYVEGFLQSMKKTGAGDQYIRECCCPRQWEAMGYRDMCDRNGINFKDISSMDYWEAKDDLDFIKIPDGVVMDKIAFMRPMNEMGSFLVNIAKMKTHGMGVTASIKNLQGISGHRFHQMCTPSTSIRKQYEKKYHKFFKKGFEDHVKALHAKHLEMGIPRWDRPDPINRSGLWMEQWVQRMLDSLSVTPTALNIVEGVYSQDGNGFGIGPHEKNGPYGVTTRDYMSNNVIFGIDPFRVDIVTHWLAGHEPGNFGLFHIGIERGMSDVLDPADIPVYLWEDGKATKIDLTSMKRTPLVTYYLQRDYGGQKEPKFHLCDEPFDYSAWKSGAKVADCTPSFEVLGKDNNGDMVGQITVPTDDNVYVDVLDNNGEILARLDAPDLEPGVHQVVWDGFCSPGLNNFYVKGMGWDATTQEVIG